MTISHPSGCAVVTQCDFNLHFANDNVEYLFLCIYFLKKCLYKSFNYF